MKKKKEIYYKNYNERTNTFYTRFISIVLITIKFRRTLEK